jgi:tetratricopeptide (TPR) repeat protein
MTEDQRTGSEQCLSPGTVMALLDEELGDEDRVAAMTHLESCAQCRGVSQELSAAATAAKSNLVCPDDERIAAYVDHRAGRMRGALSGVEMSRVRDHLSQCQRCREEAAMLTRDSTVGAGLLASLVHRLAEGGGPRRALETPKLRWAGVAAIAVAVVLFLWLSTPVGREEMSRPMPAAPQVALVDGSSGVEGSISSALADLARARQGGNAGEEALAAARVAALCHRDRSYDRAAVHYQEAAAAADRAGRRELQIDSLVLAGAVLAELGETDEARQQLEAALRLARQAGYSKGEENALMQIELLELPAAEGES